jgi:RNA polymerase sigma factor (sigma-70 family)
VTEPKEADLSTGAHRSEIALGGATQSWAHHSDLVMYARHVLGDRSDAAEDVVQEAYLRLLGLAVSDEAPTSARPWLFRVVRNLAIDERRSAARRADPVADAAILGTAALDDTAALVEHREEIAGALRDIAALPPRERKALEMDQAGIGAQAIATELGTTPNAVHQALFRARKRLRNGRAVAWGLIPVGMAPFALRLSDPALALTITNLPPGAPIGRALPVAGLVAAAMVGGSVVAPSVDRHPAHTMPVNFSRAAPATSGTPAAVRSAPVPIAKTAPATPAVNGASQGSAGPSTASTSGKGSEGGSGSGKHRSRGQGSSGDQGSGDGGKRHRGGSGSGSDTSTSGKHDGGGSSSDHGGDKGSSTDTPETSGGGHDGSQTDGQSATNPQSQDSQTAPEDSGGGSGGG